MPNRVLREGILTSERVAQLNWPAEVFYRRLMSVVDDFGRYWAKPELLRAGCYPLQLDKVGNPDIVKWIEATRKAGLVRTYTVSGKEYLELLDFRQHVRAEKSKFPDPPPDAVQLQCIRSASAHVVGDVDVDEEKHCRAGPDVVIQVEKVNGYKTQAVEVLTFLNEKTGRHYEAVPANLDLIVARLKEGTSVDDLRSVVAKKCREWSGDEKMALYLRPATLFNRTKFAQYKGELGAAA